MRTDTSRLLRLRGTVFVLLLAFCLPLAAEVTSALHQTGLGDCRSDSCPMSQEVSHSSGWMCMKMSAAAPEHECCAAWLPTYPPKEREATDTSWFDQEDDKPRRLFESTLVLCAGAKPLDAASTPLLPPPRS